MDIDTLDVQKLQRKLQFTKKEKEAAARLSKKLSKYLGEEIIIGSPDIAPINYSGVSIKDALRGWFKAGRERMAILHDENAEG